MLYICTSRTGPCLVFSLVKGRSLSHFRAHGPHINGGRVGQKLSLQNSWSTVAARPSTKAPWHVRRGKSAFVKRETCQNSPEVELLRLLKKSASLCVQF